MARDPRNVIDGADVVMLRIWAKSIMGNSWREDLSLDDLMRLNPGILYKAVCLYLQARYWGALPDDFLGSSNPLDPAGCQLQWDKSCTNPAFNWPNSRSPLEQRVFTWKLDMVPTKVPSYLAEDANTSALYMPIITPSMLIQKFDESQNGGAGAWRVLNLGGIDRNFDLMAPGGRWAIKGWDFGEWYATNADFAMVLKILGFAVVAAAAVVSGGAALAAGAGFSVILADVGAAVATAQTLVSAGTQWYTACVKQDIGAALNGLLNLVKISFNVDLKDLSSYQPGIGQIAEVMQPIINTVKKLGGDTAGDVYGLFLSTGQDVKAFVEKTEKLTSQISADTVQKMFGMLPDQFVQSALKMPASELGVRLEALKADFTARANATIHTIEGQVPLYLNDWKAHGANLVKQIGHEQAAAKSPEIPWFGRPSYDAGTAIGAIQTRLTQAAIVDINALTPAQKRALFFGEVVQICGADLGCIQNAAEYLRQADLLWGQLRHYVNYYKLG